MPRAIDPVKFALIDGREVELLLTLGGLRRLKTHYGVKALAQIFELDAAEALPIFWEAVRDKTGLDMEQFGDLLPADLKLLMETLGRLLGASFPEPKPDANPPPASPTLQ